LNAPAPRLWRVVVSHAETVEAGSPPDAQHAVVSNLGRMTRGRFFGCLDPFSIDTTECDARGLVPTSSDRNADDVERFAREEWDRVLIRRDIPEGEPGAGSSYWDGRQTAFRTVVDALRGKRRLA
jgi:hypothetical protein